MVCPKIIRVAIIRSTQNQPIKNEDGNYDFSGFEAKRLELFLRALNLPFEIIDAEDKEYGRLLDNGSWTGLIGKIQQGLADLSINSVVVTEQKTSVVDFGPISDIDDVTFAIEKPGTYPKSLAFIRPYDYTVWIPTLILLLLMPWLLRFFLNIKHTYFYAFIMILGSFLGKFSFKNNNSQRFRIISFSWSVFGMIMTLSYSTVLLSILTVPLQIPPVKNFEELSEAVMKRNYKIIVPKGSTTLDALLYNPKKYNRFLGQAAVNNSWYYNAQSKVTKDTAAIAGRSILQMLAGSEDWKVNYLSEDSLVSFMFAPAVKKGFCYKKRVDKITNSINSGGLNLKFIRSRSFQMWITMHEERFTDTAMPLTLRDLIGSFLMLSFGLGVAFFIFICEIVCYHLRRKKRTRKLVS
ncbi:lig_chan-Glu_bd domain-containing protein [Trichonephila inaurata madagascariensis]|uniref:Lig_chan-Glu_bd domain-containing protein n=2 Tax=Trichonephila inaurata madagascariensis TaxID=2747483 RepID=A0A8X6Y7Z5_9ARAC|nr:lig_chan-Glu_bd domain-containing protein [Trichonephila inaurata madagascariensis]